MITEQKVAVGGTTQSLRTFEQTTSAGIVQSEAVVLVNPDDPSKLPGINDALLVRDSGLNTAIGAQADAAATSDGGTFSLIALVKRLIGRLTLMIASLGSIDANTSSAASSSSQILIGIGTDGASPPTIAGTGVRGWLRAIYDLAVSGLVVFTRDVVSAANSVDVASLAANTAASTTLESLDGFSGLGISIKAGAASAANGLSISWYADAAGTKLLGTSDAYSVAAAAQKHFTEGRAGAYFKLNYTQGAAAGALLIEVTKLRAAMKWSSHKASEVFSDDTDLEGVKAAIAARKADGSGYVNAVADTLTGLLGTSTRPSVSAAVTPLDIAGTRTTAGTTNLRTATAGKKMYITDMVICGVSSQDTSAIIQIADNGTAKRVTYTQPRLVALTALGVILGTQQQGTWFQSFHFDEPLQFSTNFQLITADGSTVNVSAVGYEV